MLRVGKPAHMGVAGGEIAIWRREARIVLDSEEELGKRLIEPSA